MICQQYKKKSARIVNSISRSQHDSSTCKYKLAWVVNSTKRRQYDCQQNDRSQHGLLTIEMDMVCQRYKMKSVWFVFSIKKNKIKTVLREVSITFQRYKKKTVWFVNSSRKSQLICQQCMEKSAWFFSSIKAQLGVWRRGIGISGGNISPTAQIKPILMLYQWIVNSLDMESMKKLKWFWNWSRFDLHYLIFSNTIHVH